MHDTSLSPENIHVEVEYESDERRGGQADEIKQIGKVGLTENNTREGVKALIECQRTSLSAPRPAIRH